MTAQLALKLLLISVIPGIAGWLARKTFPRLAMFLMGVPMGALGLWMVTSTLELSIQGKAHTFSRHASAFSKEALPSSFEWSFWFHLLLGILIVAVGILAMVLPLT